MSFSVFGLLLGGERGWRVGNVGYGFCMALRLEAMQVLCIDEFLYLAECSASYGRRKLAFPYGDDAPPHGAKTLVVFAVALPVAGDFVLPEAAVGLR